VRVFESRVLRIMFGPKTYETTRGWKILQDCENQNMYSSPNIIRMIKYSRMIWAGHVARIGREDKCIQDFGG
jgi:acyl-coenzyme A synthetase/AMP-(fatty) acid ligase